MKNKSLEPKNKKKSMIFKTSLAMVLIVFVFSTCSLSSYFQIVKPAMAAELTKVSVVPLSDIVNQKATYDILLKTTTKAKIKAIEMTFPSTFDLTAAKLIEKEGIGFGSYSAKGSTLKYIVKNPTSVSAGTTIRLELARIVAESAGSFTASLSTLNTANNQVDGPTSSSLFSIKDIGTNNIAENSVTSPKIANNSIAAEDVSTSFTIRKTLHDDASGNAHGWNPDTSTRAFAISDSDISGWTGSDFVSVMVRSENPAFCTAESGDTGSFGVYCDSPPGNSSELDYIITKLPAHDDVTASLSASSSESTPVSPSPSSSPHTPALPNITSFNRLDDIASEFP